ncbi:MAG: RNAse Z [Flavobacteriaceae bacterium]|nr:RNAse Z [Flavobacteriaceae bacterium]
MKLTIHGYSTALYSTWYCIEELGILFDAGDGVVSHLLGKSGKIKQVFVSHEDRDHLAGLLAYNQLCAFHKPKIYFPKDTNSFRFLDEFFKKFDPQSLGTEWIPIQDKAVIKTKGGIQVEAVQNEHVIRAGQKSLSYKVFETKRKLKAEFINLNKYELIKVKTENGEDFLTEEIKTNILSFSGDTPVTDYERFNGSKILIHESTFLTRSETNQKQGKNLHSSLEEVMEMVSNIEVEQLILGHFSSRYDQGEVDQTIKKMKQHYGIKIPVHRIPIGKAVFNILGNDKCKM